MIKAVFFDLYNTLLGYEPSREEIEAQILSSFGIEVAPEALHRPLLKADEFFFTENALLKMNERSKDDVTALYTRYQTVLLKEAGIEPSRELIGGILRKWQTVKFKQVLYDDVLPTLNELKGRGLILGLISNIDRDITALFDELGLAPLLEVIVTSQETGHTKPHPAIFQEALRRARVKPQETMFVGDQYQIDVLGAEKVGMKGVLIDRGDHFNENEVGDHLRIQNLHQLKEHLS